MTKQEAITAMKKGMRITHSTFMPNEWATMDGKDIKDEAGDKMDHFLWWGYRSDKAFDDNWSYKFLPYSGGGGPTEAQRNSNTAYLGECLTKLSIPFKEDYKTMLEVCDDPNYLLLMITHSNKLLKISVSYDRWGFLASNEGDGQVFDDLLDQIKLEETVDYIKKWYNTK